MNQILRHSFLVLTISLVVLWLSVQIGVFFRHLVPRRSTERTVEARQGNGDNSCHHRANWTRT
jgi:hypothetical protein